MITINEDGLNNEDSKYFAAYKHKHFGGHRRSPTSLAWNLSGTQLATAEVLVKLWNFDEANGLDRFSEYKIQDGKDTNIQTLAFGTDNLLGSISRDSMRFWDVRDQYALKLLKSQKKIKSDFVSFAWNHTSNQSQKLIVVATKDNTMLVYDFKKLSSPLESLPIKQIESMDITKAVWDPTDSVIFLVGGQSASGSIVLIDATTFKPLPEPVLSPHCSRITDITFDNQKEYFATCSQDSLVELHLFPDLICQKVYSNKNDSNYRKVSFSCDGKYLAASSGSSESSLIQILNCEKGGVGHRIRSNKTLDSLQWNPKKMVLAYLEDEERKRSMDKAQSSSINIFHLPKHLH